MRILQLGCGPEKKPGVIAVDINPHSVADVICDLDIFPYPFSDNVFDRIICEHILEHLEDVIRTMEEIHRIAKPGARVLVQVPHFSSVYYYRDPTHRHPFSLHTFDYFIAGTPVRKFQYSDAEYRLVRAEFPPPQKASRLKRFIFRMINRYKDFYEEHLAFLIPRHLLEFELEIVKSAHRS